MNILQKIICRVSIGALFGAASVTYDKGRFSESFNLSMDGVARSRKNRNDFSGNEFFKLAVTNALKLNEERCFVDILSGIEEYGFSQLSSDLSAPLLKLSMWGFALGKLDEAIKIAKYSIGADKSNSDAYFFCGWILLEDDIDLAESYLKKGVELDRSIELRIKQDKKCMQFVRSSFYGIDS